MKYMARFLMLAVVVVFVLLPAAVLAQTDEDYLLAPDDVIVMNVWQEKELSGREMRISSQGTITVPYLNVVIKAAGLTQRELAQAIAEEYKKAEILLDPKVDINLISKHDMLVWVLGQVQRPGVVPFKEGNTISTAIAQAGSFTQNARLEAATLTRKGSDKPIPIDLRKIYRDGDLSQNYELEEGDIIYIPEDTYNRYYVLGEVRQPGLYYLKENASALSAVSLAGGPTDRASMKNVAVLRGDPQNPQRIPVNLGSIAKGKMAVDVPLQPGDVVYVPETSKPDWTRISQIVGTIVNVSYIRRYGLF